MHDTKFYLIKYFIVVLALMVLASCKPPSEKTSDTEVMSSLPTVQAINQRTINPSLLAEWTTGRVEDMAWSPDSKMFAFNYYLSGDNANNHIRAFDVDSLKQLWEAENSLAMNLIFTSDGQFIVESNIVSPELYLRNVGQGNVIHDSKSTNCQGGGQFVIANPSEGTVLIADTNDLVGTNTDNIVIIRQWNLESDQCQNLVQYRGGFDIFDLNYNGHLLAFGGEGEDDSVVIWDMEKQAEICHTKKVDYGRFLPESNILVVSREQSVVFIDAVTCQDLRELPVTTTGTYLALSPDGQMFAIATETLQILETTTGENLAEIPFPKNAAVYSHKLFSGGIEFSPDGQYLLIAFSTGAYSGKIQLWRLIP